MIPAFRTHWNRYVILDYLFLLESHSQTKYEYDPLVPVLILEEKEIMNYNNFLEKVS